MHVVIMCVCVFVELRAVIMELNCCKSAHVMYILLLHEMHKLVVVYHMYMYICWIFFDNVLLQCAPLYTRLFSFKCIGICYIFSSKIDGLSVIFFLHEHKHADIAVITSNLMHAFPPPPQPPQ